MNYVHLGCFSFRIDRAGACKKSIGEALQDGINLNDEIKEILAKYCSEHVGDYFALCEKRWMVKQ